MPSALLSTGLLCDARCWRRGSCSSCAASSQPTRRRAQPDAPFAHTFCSHLCAPLQARLREQAHALREKHKGRRLERKRQLEHEEFERARREYAEAYEAEERQREEATRAARLRVRKHRRQARGGGV